MNGDWTWPPLLARWLTHVLPTIPAATWVDSQWNVRDKQSSQLNVHSRQNSSPGPWRHLRSGWIASLIRMRGWQSKVTHFHLLLLGQVSQSDSHQNRSSPPPHSSRGFVVLVLLWQRNLTQHQPNSNLGLTANPETVLIRRQWHSFGQPPSDFASWHASMLRLVSIQSYKNVEIYSS